MSRIEKILSGTYTGQPLSRVEELLMNGGAGGGTVDLSGVNTRISEAETTINMHSDALLTLSEKMDNAEDNIEKLNQHAILDSNVNNAEEEE